MVHYPSHEREAFTNWIDDGFPEHATVEEAYTPRQIGADDLLLRFLLPDACTDTMPKHYTVSVAEHVGFDGDVAGISYGLAASALLVQRAAGDGPAVAFLAKLLAQEDAT